jgi:hypothetical protein
LGTVKLGRRLALLLVVICALASSATPAAAAAPKADLRVQYRLVGAAEPTPAAAWVAPPPSSRTPAAGSVGPSLVDLTLYLMSFDQQVALLGQNAAVAPPDTMMAAGPTVLVETLNRSISVWSKSGNLRAVADFGKLLGLPPGYQLSDPRVLYDAQSGRFLVSGVAVNAANDSAVYVLVSRTSTLQGGFYKFKFAQTANGELHDQPKLGVSDDKVTLTWDDFLPGSVFAGSEIWVLDKAALLSGRRSPAAVIGPSTSRPSPVPVQSLTTTTTQYVVFNHHFFTGVVAITGTPATNDVIAVETDFLTPGTIDPPPALQSGGGPIETGDDRYQSAVWRDQSLWTAGNDSCQPAGTGLVRACLRLVQISTAGTPSLLQTGDIGNAGSDYYYPAVTVDPAGDAFLSFSYSSGGQWPSAVAARISAGAPFSAITIGVYQLGLQAYGGQLWGDYSAISLDPVAPVVWGAAEYMENGSTHDWGTAAARIPI